MNNYVNISLDLTLCQQGIMDFKVPVVITVKQFLSMINVSYNLKLDLNWPIIRVAHNGKVLTSLKRLNEEPTITNGTLLIVEAI